MKKENMQWNTLSTGLTARIAAIIMSVVIGALSSWLIALRAIQIRANDFCKSMINVRLSIIEEEQSQLLNQFYHMTENDADIWTVTTNPEVSRQMLGIMNLSKKFNRLINEVRSFDCIYFYNDSNKTWAVSQCDFNQQILRQYAIQKFMDNGRKNLTSFTIPLHFDRIGDSDVLVCLYNMGDLQMAGIIKVDSLTSRIMKDSNDYFSSLQILPTASVDNNIADISGLIGFLFHLNVTASSGNFSLIGKVNLNNPELVFAFFQCGVLLLTIIASVILLAFFLFHIERCVVCPVLKFAEEIQEIGTGILTSKPDASEIYYSEYQYVVESFNKMLDQIDALEKSIYKENMRRNQIELKYFQLQSSPHYYQNSLNVLYNMSLKNDNEKLKKMILSLAQQSRYILKSIDTFTLVRKELEHIKGYLMFQEYRTPYKIDFTEDIDEEMLEVEIPPLCLHTFVENSFKYGLSQDRVYRIKISAKATIFQGAPAIIMSEEDEGPGFTREVLDSIERGNVFVDELGIEHFGIDNLMGRMDILYKGKMCCRYYNKAQGGAKVELIIPIHSKEVPGEITDC